MLHTLRPHPNFFLSTRESIEAATDEFFVRLDLPYQIAENLERRELLALFNPNVRCMHIVTYAIRLDTLNDFLGNKHA